MLDPDGPKQRHIPAKEERDSYRVDASDRLGRPQLRVHLDARFDHVGWLRDQGGRHPRQEATAEGRQGGGGRRADI